jgi:sigma-E factor negative regulatory protein RseB
MQHFPLVLVLGLIFASSPCVHAQEAGSQTGSDWLRSMHRAVTGLNYQGSVSYIKDQQVDSFKVYHAQRDGEEKERLVSMNSPLREVVRTGNNISRYSQDSEQVLVETRPSEHSLLVALPDDLAVLEKIYRITLMGREYVAGLQSQVVALEPRDGFRYSRILWIDVATKLPLKLDVLNEEGQSVEQMVFTSINTRDTISPKELEPSLKSRKSITQISHRESLPLKDLRWKLGNVPEGFQIVSYSILKNPPSKTPVEQILLSDGFSAVSVYVEARDDRQPSGLRRMGAVNVDVVGFKDQLVTVMGEVPLRTVESIAKGLSEKVSP